MGLDQLDELYDDAILDHRRKPRNHHRLEGADITADGVNPFCGDEIHLQINLDEGGRADQVGLQGEGCSINQASGSMLTEAIQGKTLVEIEAVASSFSDMMQGDGPSQDAMKRLGDLEAMSGVRQFPVRIKCALLAWDALEDGIESYRRDHP
jgi:nitrogen fixation NifU-like protein